MKFILILVFGQFVLICAQKIAPVVDSPLGKIRGNVMISRNGESFLAFRGIRYAQSPVNDLRFKVTFKFNVLS